VSRLVATRERAVAHNAWRRMRTHVHTRSWSRSQCRRVLPTGLATPSVLSDACMDPHACGAHTRAHGTRFIGSCAIARLFAPSPFALARINLVSDPLVARHTRAPMRTHHDRFGRRGMASAWPVRRLARYVRLFFYINPRCTPSFLSNESSDLSPFPFSRSQALLRLPDQYSLVPSR
jgi:hypothetical protein